MSNLEPHAHFADSRFQHPSPTSLIGQVRTGMETRPKLGNKTCIVKFNIPWPKMNNPTLDSVDSIPFDKLTIQTDGLDKKAPEVSTTLIPPPEQGAVGTAITDGQTKLDIVPRRRGRTGDAQDLRTQI